MRTSKKRTDFLTVSRRSVALDFQMSVTNAYGEKRPEIEKEAKINDEKRIIHISDRGEYAKFARFIVGKLVRVLERSDVGGNSFYCSFVHDSDRIALNGAAGWSNNKTRYLFEGVKFK